MSCLFSFVVANGNEASSEKALLDSIEGAHRTEAYVVRDVYRHPAETLLFFDIQPDMSVVEIWPGSGGWYTEILAPYLRLKGKLYAAQFDAESKSNYYTSSREKFIAKMSSQEDIYNAVEVTTFDPPGKIDIAPEGSADRVLTFRSVHNWYMRGGEDTKVQAAFAAFFKALKPGGILGVVEHRLPAARPLTDQNTSGYMRQDYVIEMAESVGFKLVETSEINANPRDTADHPKGVWTLPPTLTLKDENRDHYVSIGESDRMTLKFLKPE